MAHAMDQCEVNMMIPFNPMEPWSGSIIGSEPNTDVELMVHMALTTLCEDRLTATAALTIALLPIGDQENLIWQLRLEAMSNLKGPHFRAGMTSLAKYTHVIPCSEKEGTKPPYVCPGCSNHTYSNNMITRFHVQ
jgi:hypothetical protein